MRKSTILLVIPKIEKFSRSRELGVEQAIAWSRIADCGGCDKGLPVRTLTPACSRALNPSVRDEDPTYCDPQHGQTNL